MVTKRRIRKPVVAVVRPVHHRTRRRRNPSTRSNPGGGISGIVMNGLWVGVGMWVGGMVNGMIGGLISPLTSSLGVIGGIANGIITAYAVQWIGNRTVGHGDLMAAGAFAGTAMSAISGVLGGVGSAVSSLTSGISAGTSAAPTQVTSPSVGSQNAVPLHAVN
jgi:hypothetical protein